MSNKSTKHRQTVNETKYRTKFTTRHPRTPRLRRRIWWSIYVSTSGSQTLAHIELTTLRYANAKQLHRWDCQAEYGTTTVISSHLASQIWNSMRILSCSLPSALVNLSILPMLSRWWRSLSYVSIPMDALFCIRPHVANVLFAVGRIIDTHFVLGRSRPNVDDARDLDEALETWKNSLPEDARTGTEEGTASVWTCLLHLAYKHVLCRSH